MPPGTPYNPHSNNFLHFGDAVHIGVRSIGDWISSKPKVGGTLEAPSVARPNIMASMEEQMKCKRQKVVTLQSTLPNQSKTLRIVTFTKEQLPSSHLMETGELLGMIVFNDCITSQPSFRTTRPSCGLCCHMFRLRDLVHIY